MINSIKELLNYILGDMAAYHINAINSPWYIKIKNLRYLRRSSPTFNCVFWLRINQYLYRKQNSFLNYLCKRVSVWRVYTFGNDISYKAIIGPGLRIVHLSDIVIGTGAKIGNNLTLLNGVTLGKKSRTSKGMPNIGNNVYLGTGSKIIGDVEIGDNVVIGALTFCDKNIPADTVAYGNPLVIRI